MKKKRIPVPVLVIPESLHEIGYGNWRNFVRLFSKTDWETAESATVNELLGYATNEEPSVIALLHDDIRSMIAEVIIERCQPFEMPSSSSFQAQWVLPRQRFQLRNTKLQVVVMDYRHVAAEAARQIEDRIMLLENKEDAGTDFGQLHADFLLARCISMAGKSHIAKKDRQPYYDENFVENAEKILCAMPAYQVLRLYNFFCQAGGLSGAGMSFFSRNPSILAKRLYQSNVRVSAPSAGIA